MATAIDTHVCGIDCKPSVSATGGIAHDMYPADSVNWTRATYVNAAGITRREYRATYGDESRNVRVWNAQRAERANAYPLPGSHPLAGRWQDEIAAFTDAQLTSAIRFHARADLTPYEADRRAALVWEADRRAAADDASRAAWGLL